MDRICKECDLLKPLEDFPKRKSCKEGRTRVCKTCYYASVRDYKNEYYSKYRRKNRKEVRDYNKKYLSQYQKRKHSENTELRRNITIEKYLISVKKKQSTIDKHKKILNDLNDRLTELLINEPVIFN